MLSHSRVSKPNWMNFFSAFISELVMFVYNKPHSALSSLSYSVMKSASDWLMIIYKALLGVCPTQQCAAVTTQFCEIIVPPHPTLSKWTIHGHEYLSAVFPPTILCSDWWSVFTSDCPIVLQRSEGGRSGCRLQLNEWTVVTVLLL